MFFMMNIISLLQIKAVFLNLVYISLDEHFQANRSLCLGAQSFEHANVLSEKINFSALGGPGVAIFGPDYLHPMY